MCRFFVVFWAALVAFALWVMFRNRPEVRERVSGLFADPRSQADPAEEILRGRLARGEVDAEEYDRVARTLKG
jgi:uncharacterized membrane protein